MAQIGFDEVTKVYEDGTEAVRAVDLTIEDGTLMVLVGPSGCGKTTLLRMVAGLEEITGGSIRLGDAVINDVEAKNRDLAMVFQNYALYPHMTCYDNMAFGLKLRKVPRKEIDRRVRETARTLGLEDQLKKKPRALSGGQRQRVAMGRAIVREPQAFLMDEPLSNLDAKLRVQMRTEISRIQRDLGTTMIYVTHDQTEAMTMGDRVAVLKDGYLQQVDTPQNLYDHPANVFVAAFIGSPSMNLYDAVLTIEGDTGTIQVGTQQLTLAPDSLAARPGLRAYDSRPVVLGVRPEDFEDAAMIPAPSVGSTLKGQVNLLESLGSEIMVHFALDATSVDSGDPDGGKETVVTATTNAVGRFHPRSRVRIGETIEVAVAIENLHFFDHQSHLAIWT